MCAQRKPASVIPRITCIIPSLAGGGAERNIAWLANQWVANSGMATVITMSGTDNDFYILSDTVDRDALALITDSANLLQSLSANVARYRALKKAIARSKPDIVISFTTSTNVLSLLAARRLGIPVIISERNYPPRMRLQKQWKWLRKTFYKRADCVVAQTNKGAQWLEVHTQASKVSVIPNPVVHPVKAVQPVIMPDEHIDSHSKVLLAIGNASEQKGFDVLLAAFTTLVADFPEWKLVILGEGNATALRAQSEQLNLAQRVLFPGRVGNVSNWYERADVFVLSSRYEGFPNVLVEAMAAGVAVVSTDCETGPADIITHAYDGVLCATENAQALAGSLRQLMSDESLRVSLGSEAVAVQERFSTEVVFRCWLDLIRDVLVSRES